MVVVADDLEDGQITVLAVPDGHIRHDLPHRLPVVLVVVDDVAEGHGIDILPLPAGDLPVDVFPEVRHRLGPEALDVAQQLALRVGEHDHREVRFIAVEPLQHEVVAREGHPRGMTGIERRGVSFLRERDLIGGRRCV